RLPVPACGSPPAAACRRAAAREASCRGQRQARNRATRETQGQWQRGLGMMVQAFLPVPPRAMLLQLTVDRSSRFACFITLREPCCLLGWGLRAGRLVLPLTDSGGWTTLRPDMRHLSTRSLVLRAGRVLAARGRLAFQ